MTNTDWVPREGDRVWHVGWSEKITCGTITKEPGTEETERGFYAWPYYLDGEQIAVADIFPTELAARVEQVNRLEAIQVTRFNEFASGEVLLEEAKNRLKELQ